VDKSNTSILKSRVAVGETGKKRGEKYLSARREILSL
jgi:hypothetical protein